MDIQVALIIALVLLLAACAFVLHLGGRQQRVDRQIAIALPSTPSALGNVSLRTTRSGGSLDRMRRYVLNYDIGAVYMLPIVPMALVGGFLGAAVCYIGYFLGFELWMDVTAGVVVAWLLVRGVLGWQQQRYRNQLFRQLPDVVELVTSTVRAGLPVSDAFRIVAREMPEPTARQFALICDEIGLGRAPEEALFGVYTRTHVTEYSMFAVTLAVQMKSGGRLAETLQILGDTVRQRVALAGRAKALAGEVIFSARAMTAAPFITGGIMYFASPKSIDMLLFDPRGRVLLAYAVTSIIGGVLVLRWMIRKETTI